MLSRIYRWIFGVPTYKVEVRVDVIKVQLSREADISNQFEDKSNRGLFDTKGRNINITSSGLSDEDVLDGLKEKINKGQIKIPDAKFGQETE
jgi:hypothetical protein